MLPGVGLVTNVRLLQGAGLVTTGFVTRGRPCYKRQALLQQALLQGEGFVTTGFVTRGRLCYNRLCYKGKALLQGHEWLCDI